MLSVTEDVFTDVWLSCPTTLTPTALWNNSRSTWGLEWKGRWQLPEGLGDCETGFAFIVFSSSPQEYLHLPHFLLLHLLS